MYKKIAPCLFVVFAMFGCSSVTKNVSSSVSLNPAKSCAVMPFINDTNHYGADDAVAALVETELQRKGSCVFVEQSEVAQKLKALGVEKDRLFDKNYALSLASKIGVDYLFVGRVTEYNYQYGLREDPAVGISMKLIDAKEQKFIWAGDEGRVKRSYLLRDSLAATAIESVRSVLSEIK